METYSVEILNPKAIRLLEDLADLELISIKKNTPLLKQTVLSDEERAIARERIMRGGSQTLDVEEMAVYVNEMRDRKLPFRDE